MNQQTRQAFAPAFRIPYDTLRVAIAPASILTRFRPFLKCHAAPSNM